ncbi:MAG TPA: transposase [Rectinema sp.]|nr:transposase [Rectinema sp.]HNT59980.1 transposase [Rectinema sp.]HOH17062.1 transposase [Rectinema sp.]HOR47945.1 transposase [Rectinema sp.]HPB61823.1 transposase [Rectinema sp.]
MDARKMASRNTLERLNKEIRRRSKAIGVLPSVSSYIRLICSCLIEYEKDWQTGKSYIKAESLVKQQALFYIAA